MLDERPLRDGLEFVLNKRRVGILHRPDQRGFQFRTVLVQIKRPSIEPNPQSFLFLAIEMQDGVLNFG